LRGAHNPIQATINVVMIGLRFMAATIVLGVLSVNAALRVFWGTSNNRPLSLCSLAKASQIRFCDCQRI
jgi:hypothetical protein